MDLKPHRLPIRIAHGGALHQEPAALVEAAQQAVAKVDILFKMAFEPRQALHARVDSDFAGHGVEDARLNAVRGVGGVGAEAHAAHAVLLAGVFKEKRVGQQGEDAANAALVVGVLLAAACLLGGRAGHTAQLLAFKLGGIATQRASAGRDQARHRAICGFNLLREPALMLGLLGNPVAPVAVALVVVQLVVDNLAHQSLRRCLRLALSGWRRLGESGCGGEQSENERDDAHGTLPGPEKWP